MHANHLLLEEPIRMASILEPSKASFFPAMTKIVGTLGPKSRSIDDISGCLNAGMSVARFDFSWGDPDYHQETLENLKAAIKTTKKLCFVMLDTVGPELQVVNKTEKSISLQADATVVLTPDPEKEASSELFPINFDGLAKAVKKGDTIFIGQYLFTGSETTSVWLEVLEVAGDDVVCVVKNSATLAGSRFTLHGSQIRIELPTLSEKDKEVISTWGVQNKIDFLSLSYTRHAEDVRQAREFLSKLGDLSQTQIFAKIENIEGLNHFDEILQEADGIILSHGNLGIDLPPEKVFLFQKTAVYKCNTAGKPAVVTRVVDSMTDNLRPTRAEATDVANAVLDGTDAILLGAETLRGLYPVETISTVGRICAEAEKVFNQDLYFKKTVKYVGEPMSHLESIACSAVCAIVGEVLRIYLAKYEKRWDGREVPKIAGKTPVEAAAAIVEDYGLPCSTEELISEITPIFGYQWSKIKALPGANRLIKHLRGHGVSMALASNSPKASTEMKISLHEGWKEAFTVIIGGDEVTEGKPCPEIFLAAANGLKLEPSKIMVIEDSMPGVMAGQAAGTEVVAVPSLPKQNHLYTSADEGINSLLYLRPEKWGLPAFQDWVEDTLPIEPWHIGGPVIKGFGRGSKVLGIPTANLSTNAYSELLSEQPTGVFFGWAALSSRGVYKVVMSIGWNPYFNNAEKTIEPWLLHDFEEDFYGEELRLVNVGYIRPEANFPSLEALVEKIHDDRRVAEKALDLPIYSKYRDHPYLNF